MANSYSTDLRLIMQSTGSNIGQWGDYTNTNIGVLLEQAIAGVGAIAVSGSSDYTLSVANGASDESRNAVLNITGTLTAAINVVCPTSAKTYIVKNGTTGGFAITLKTAAGTGISVPNGSTLLLYCDGTNVVNGIYGLSSENVNFLQSGTGAVTRTVQFKERDTVSVKDFGAVGDGVTDDTAAIQAAINSGSPYSTSTTSGLQIYFPHGKYKISTALDLSNCHGVGLIGAGPYATEIFTTSTTEVIKGIGTSSTSLMAVSVCDMTIRGGGLSNTGAHGINFQWVNSGLIENVIFFGCRNAVNLYHQWQTVLFNLRIVGAGADQNYTGVWMGESDLTHIDNAVQATNVLVQNTTAYGFRLINAQGSKFLNCEAGGGMIYGWYIGDPTTGTVKCQWIHIANCLSDSTVSAAWLLKQGAATEISQIQLANCWAGNGDYGFYLDGCTSITMANLLVVGNNNSGLRMVNSSYNTITGSQFLGNNEVASASVGDINVQGGSYNRFTGNMSNSNAAGKSYMEAGSTDANMVADNTLFQSATIVGANTQLNRNQGAKAENVGSAEITAAATSVTVTHGLVITPNINAIRVTPRDEMGTATKFYVSNVTATTFDINVNVAPGATITLAWAIDMSRI